LQALLVEGRLGRVLPRTELIALDQYLIDLAAARTAEGVRLFTDTRGKGRMGGKAAEVTQSHRLGRSRGRFQGDSHKGRRVFLLIVLRRMRQIGYLGDRVAQDRVHGVSDQATEQDQVEADQKDKECQAGRPILRALGRTARFDKFEIAPSARHDH
jgi:hypothetical protein